MCIRDSGMSMLRYASGGGRYEYTPEQRELIYRYMGEENLGEVIASNKFMGNPFFNEVIGKVRALKAKGKKPRDDRGNVFDYKVELTPVHSAINNLLDDAKARAEDRLRQENPKIADSIFAQRRIDRLMQQGRVDEANQAGDQANPQNNRSQQIQQLSQFR